VVRGPRLPILFAAGISLLDSIDGSALRADGKSDIY
jgi:high-affinity nickel permease